MVIILTTWYVFFFKSQRVQRITNIDLMRSRRNNSEILRESTKLVIAERFSLDLTDCSSTTRYCAFDMDCDNLCKDFQNVSNANATIAFHVR